MWIQVLLLSVLAYFAFRWLIQGKRKLGNAPPGPYQWPLFGNLIQLNLADPVFPHNAMQKLADKYGDIMSIKFGVHDAVVISSFETMKDLLTKDEFSGRFDAFPFVEARSFHKILGVIFMSGPEQKELRRYTIRNLRDFGFGKRTSTVSVMEDELREFLVDLNTKVDKKNNLLRVDSSLFALSFVNILWASVAGFRFSHSNKDLQHIIELNDAVIQSWRYDNISVPYPALAYWFPEMTGYNHQLKTFVGLQDFMRELIYKVKKTYEAEADGQPRTFLECFLKDMENADENSIFTEEQLIMVLKDLFLGGSETTSNTLSFALLYLVLNPDVQKKVQDEIDAVTGSSDFLLEASLLPRMPYTEATILEIMRISKVVPMPIPRKTMGDYHYKGYLIPKGAALFFNLSSVLMDKKYWGDPESFRPGRFLDESGTKIINSERVIPFGYGKRICMGETLARDSFFTYFTTMLKRYTFKVPPGQLPPTTEPKLSFTMSPKPFDVVMIPRGKA